MAEEQAAQAAEEAQEQDQGQEAEKPQGDTVDWKAESRKWEALAKKGKAAEEELEQLKAAQMSEQEKANARADKAEAELNAMKAEAERLEAARAVSAKTDVPLELLEYCMDADSMEEFAKVYLAKQAPIHSAPRAQASNVAVGEGKASNADLFAKTAQQFFKS